jgi:N-acetylneuraminic acid mutarotase
MKKYYIILIFLLTRQASYSQWAATDAMSASRGGHVCANLSNGNVLVAGGWDYTNNLNTVEIFDAVSNTWSNVEDMIQPRYLATATTLDNGNVLIVGGYDGTSNLATCEIYNPSTNSWSYTGNLSVGRSSHTATKLQNGMVLVVGGYTGSLNTPVCELYDPTSNTWTSAGTLTFGRSYHTATLLNNGNVAIIGGYDPNSTFQLASLEIYNPSTNNWTAGASMIQARDYHAASKLIDGKILVSGGRVFTGSTPNYNGLNTAEIYDPVSNSWDTASAFTDTPICYGQQVTLNNGNVLNIAGVASFDTQTGASTPSVAYIYYPSFDVWDTTTMVRNSRFEFASILMNDGRVMVSGGGDSTVELYGLAQQTKTSDLNNLNSFEIYPNPTSKILFLKLNRIINNIDAISVWNTQGQQVNSRFQSNLGNLLQFETSELCNGIYFVKIADGNTNEIKKFTIIH